MSFQYTSGDPAHLTGGQDASMADIQGLFTDLRTFLNARIAAIPTLVSSLPVSPVDGQEIYYQADGTNGVIWHLRYRAASGSTFKWEYVGGPPLWSADETTVPVVVGSPADLSPVVSIIVPLAGDYDVDLGVRQMVSLNGGQTDMALNVAGTVTDLGSVSAGTQTGQAPGSMERRKTGLAASTVVKLQMRAATAGPANSTGRWLRVRPVRVG